MISWYSDVHTVTTLAAIAIIRAKRTNEILGLLAYQQTGKTKTYAPAENSVIILGVC